MSHVSLYRKYRPTSFDQVLGQDAIVQSLQSAIKSGNISHAYLFAGSRGTGKTSIARIFAHDLGISQNDIYEIDAASNNGVDEIRALTAGVTTLPFDSKYKIYILDEVHMLSKSSFNALLKTLEEPPKHVIFILATTELHKILPTVVSRCQVFAFQKPSIEILERMITDGAKQEGRQLGDGVAKLIAQRGDGAFRDAWGILERILESTSEKKISIQEVVAITHAPHHESVHDFVKNLVEKNIEKTLDAIHTVSDGGQTMDHFLEQVIQMCRTVLLVRFSPAFAETLMMDYNSDTQADIKTWAGEKNIINADLLVELLSVMDEVKKTSIPIIPVELAIMRILGQNA